MPEVQRLVGVGRQVLHHRPPVLSHVGRTVGRIPVDDKIAYLTKQCVSGNFQVDVRSGGTGSRDDVIGLDVFDNIFGYFSRRPAELLGQGEAPDRKVAHFDVGRKSDFQLLRRPAIGLFSGRSNFIQYRFFELFDRHLKILRYHRRDLKT